MGPGQLVLGTDDVVALWIRSRERDFGLDWLRRVEILEDAGSQMLRGCFWV